MSFRVANAVNVLLHISAHINLFKIIVFQRQVSLLANAGGAFERTEP